MKVAMFTRFPKCLDSPRGGVETVALALVRALARREDVEVDVVTLERNQRRLAKSDVGRATIHRLPGSRCPQILDILAGPGRARLKRYLAALQPDVVHFHETYGLGIGRLPMPSVFTVHGFDHANIPAEGRPLAWLRTPLWRWVEQRCMARQHDVISITPYVRGHITRLTKARIYDIENPIDPACFEVPRREAPGRVFFAGWISPRKNSLTVVRAFAKVVQAGVDADLRLAGEVSDEAYAASVREAVRTSGLEERVTLLGRVSPTDIRRELGEACVFVLPSYQENSPMAIAEALAAGVPVVTSNRCGMPHMVQEGRTGFLLEPDDVDGIADRLRTLLEDRQRREDMGEQSRCEARRRFHPDSVASRTVEVYRELIRRADSTA
jgi:glycosyltransferase involved in cell wall biosynthesis